MSRLLFAAARGARVEYQSGGPWQPTDGSLVGIYKFPWRYRIHPDDEHLQYGPISSALREFAETGKWPDTLSALAASAMFDYEREYPFVLASEWSHAQMFALFLAEALADEGV